MEQLWSTTHRYLAPHRHSILLAALIGAFAVRPLLGDNEAANAIFGVALLVLLLVALYNINVDQMMGEKGRLLAQSRRRRMIGWVLAIAAGAERVSFIFVQNPIRDMVGTITWLLFLGFVTLGELRSVLKQKEVTGETICMAISVYLFIGFTWALLYGVIFQLHPESFGNLAVAIPGHPIALLHILPVLG